MTKAALLRWALFFLVGLPFQLVVYVVYPFVALYFWIFIRSNRISKSYTTILPKHSLSDLVRWGGQDKIRDNWYLDHDDTHNAMIHVGLWSYQPDLAKEGLRHLMTPEGSLKRRYPHDQNLSVSGDCLSAWVHAYSLIGGYKEDLKALVTHYLKNCFGLVDFNGKVSARSSNAGLGYVYDGAKGINQPCFGPQYYTSAALFALAKKELGGLWHGVYWAHWLLMGGWLWWLCPIIYTKSNDIYYAHHVTALNLNTLEREAPSVLNRQAMRTVVKRIESKNGVQPFLYALAWNAGAFGAYVNADPGIFRNADQYYGIEVLKRVEQVWPQHNPSDDNFFDKGLNRGCYSMMGLAAQMFLNAPGWRIKK